MKNFLCLFAVCFVLGSGVAEIIDILTLNDQEKSNQRKILDACYIVTGTNQTVINELEKNLDSACAQNLGCFLACYSQAVKILKSNGRVDMTPLKGNLSPENYKIAETCWSQAPVVGDLCYQTFEAYTCYAAATQSQQIPQSRQNLHNLQFRQNLQFQEFPKFQEHQPIQLVPYFGYNNW